ncbi:MAG: 3-phosphoshikimate 1-carboxyvinyltransferase [Spirochaetales bacterium]|nr:3-phosphoshikimate 1-carboxyvinyltransferase [Spirochaetales bacterium]
MDTRIQSLEGKKLNSSAAVAIPSSKSHTIRALLIAAMADGNSRLINPLDSADARSCIDACRKFGALIDTSSSEDEMTVWTVKGSGGVSPPDINTIDVGNSGTTLYLAAGMAALAKTEVRFTGDNQIQNRPVKALLDALSDLGAEVSLPGASGCPPFQLKGPLKGGETSIECPTSQYLSSLLLCCPLAEGDSIINVPLLMERPYVEMTLRWLDSQGIEYTNEHFKRFTIPGRQRYRSFESRIPGDFSSAAFFLCAAAITGSRLTLEGLDVTDSQGDKAILDYLSQMGCNIETGADSVTISGPARLKAACLDLNDTPDALPAMAVAACFAEGESILHNVPQARLKETDRIAVMRGELSKLGAEIKEREDGLIIRGGKQLKGCHIEGHEDHRVVMSLAIAALCAEGETVITGAEAVDITYPGFFEQLRLLTDG